jgi:hypothetical protein
MTDTVTLGDSKKFLIRHFPQYNHDDYLELFFYKTYTDDPETILHDKDLRNIFKVCKAQSMTKLIISLSTPIKPFSA